MDELIQLHDLTFGPLISAERIAERVATLAAELRERLGANGSGRTPLFVAVLNGAAIFHADLIRAYGAELEVGYIRTRSYEGLHSSGKLQLEIPEDLDLENRQVVIVEDIADSGRTLDALTKVFEQGGAADLITVVLLDKPAAREMPFVPDYVGFEVAPEFVVGYGLDYDGLGRNLASIYRLVEAMG